MNWAQFIRDSATVATSYNTFQTSKKLDSLNDALDDFKNQTSAELGRLTDTIQKGFSMLSMELAVQSKIFKNILNVLKEKRKTEAEELKNFGLKALRNGWINDAIEDFNKSIELNRYDYQVYYLLSKCYFLQDDIIKQTHFLQMSFQYSAEDSLFRQYVGLDIVGQLIKDKKFDEAKEVVAYLEGLLDGDINITPLLMCKLYIAIFSGVINDSTLDIIDKAIDNYEGDEPSRIIMVISALSNFVDSQKKLLIENKLNLKKFSIAKKYGIHVLTYTENIEKILTFIHTNAEDNSILKIAPAEVISKYFPLYKKIPQIIDSIKDFKVRIANATIEDYDKFNFISPLIKQIEKEILQDVKNVFKKSDDGNFNSNPFLQNFKPELDFNVGEGDKILVQCKLSKNEIITLTLFKLIIIDKKKNIFSYDLIDDFLNVEKDEIRIDDYNVNNKISDNITFYLRDKVSEKILLFSSSNYYTESYGSKDRFANILNLLWSRAINNILIYLTFKKFNANLQLLNIYIKFFGVGDIKASKKHNETSKTDVSIDNISSDVEFID